MWFLHVINDCCSPYQTLLCANISAELVSSYEVFGPESKFQAVPLNDQLRMVLELFLSRSGLVIFAVVLLEWNQSLDSRVEIREGKFVISSKVFLKLKWNLHVKFEWRYKFKMLNYRWHMKRNGWVSTSRPLKETEWSV